MGVVTLADYNIYERTDSEEVLIACCAGGRAPRLVNAFMLEGYIGIKDKKLLNDFFEVLAEFSGEALLKVLQFDETHHDIAPMGATGFSEITGDKFAYAFGHVYLNKYVVMSVKGIRPLPDAYSAKVEYFMEKTFAEELELIRSV